MARRKTHPGSIRRRAPGKYQIRIRHEGESRTETYEGTQKGAERRAEEIRGEIESQIRRVRRGGAKRALYSDADRKYRAEDLPGLSPGAQRSYRASLSTLKLYFAELMGDPPLDQWEPQDVEAFVRWRRNHKATGEEREIQVSPHTALKDFRVLRRVLSRAESWKWIRGNPAKHADLEKPHNREYVILDEDQYNGLVAKCYEESPVLGLFSEVLGETGCRVGEALGLRWEDYRDGRLFIDSRTHGRRTKSNKSRTVPVSPRLARSLTKHFTAFRDKVYGEGEEAAPSPWLFHHLEGTPAVKAGSRILGFREPWDRARTAAKTPAGFRAHDLRHRRATRWLQEGHSLSLVSKALGHSTTQVTETYSHLVDDDLMALVASPERPEPEPTTEFQAAVEKAVADAMARVFGTAPPALRVQDGGRP